MENNELNSSPAFFGMEISSNCYFPTGFDDPNDPFESALSSMVSSPTSNGGGLISGDGMMIRELIGRLGSICDSGEISPQSCIATANNTPLNSPPKFNLSPLSLLNHTSSAFQNQPPTLAFFNGDPGFAERAAKYSSFGIGEVGIGNRSGADLQNGKLSRVSSNLSSRGANSQFDGSSGVCANNNGEMGDSREGSSVSEQINPGGEIGVKIQNDANSRKRKSISKAKVKESSSPAPHAKDDKGEAVAENGDEGSNAKRSKTGDEEAKRENAGQSNSNSKDKQSNSNNNNSNNKDTTAKPEPPKDYIHVRARRGQATDSHSLAERVRREKISERMKFLQDLVPGCNKVTGKATVLDEIINYVQSLQRQVEFLSMKLANVNPRIDFNMEALLSKDMFPCRPQTMYPLDQSSSQAFPYGFQSSQQLPPTLLNVIPNGTAKPFSVNPLNATGIHRNPTLQMPSIGRLTDPMTQLPTFWDDDLQSIVQMGIAQNQTQTGPGTLSNPQMKVEL